MVRTPSKSQPTRLPISIGPTKTRRFDGVVSPTEVELEDTLGTEDMMGTVSKGPVYRGGQDLRTT